MSQDIRNLGTYANIAALWEAHPEGGREGDYATISGTRYRWNKYDRIWENAATVTQSTGRRNQINEGDFTVNGKAKIGGNARIKGNLYVEGTLDATNVKTPCRGLFPTVEALKAAYPNPKPGWWAIVGDNVPGPLYHVEDGEWEAILDDNDDPVEGGGGEIDMTDYFDPLDERLSAVEEAVDDIPELADDLETNDSTKALTAKQGKILNESVVKHTEQSLTDAQKTQARANIDAACKSDVDRLILDFDGLDEDSATVELEATYNTAISNSATHQLSSPLKAGRTYILTIDSLSVVSSIAVYPRDSEGNSVPAYWGNEQSTATNKQYSDSTSRRSIKPVRDVYGFGFYATKANVVQSGTVVFTAISEAVDGIDDKLNKKIDSSNVVNGMGSRSDARNIPDVGFVSDALFDKGSYAKREPDYTTIQPFSFADSGNYGSSDTYKHSDVIVFPGEIVRVKANQNNSAIIAFVSHLSCPGSGLEYGLVGSSRLTVDAGKEAIFVVPDGTVAMKVYMGTLSDDVYTYKPQSLFIYRHKDSTIVPQVIKMDRYGTSSSSPKYGYVSGATGFGFPVKSGKKYSIRVTGSGTATKYAIFTSGLPYRNKDITLSDSTNNSFSTASAGYTVTAPSDGMLTVTKYTGGSFSVSISEIKDTFVNDIDDLSTIKILNYEKVSVNKLAHLSFYIKTATGLWAASATYKSVLYPVAPGQIIKVNPSLNGAIMFWLASNEAPTDGTLPDCPTGHLERIFISSDSPTCFLRVPDGANFLYIYTGSNNAYVPSYFGIAAEVAEKETNESSDIVSDFCAFNDKQILLAQDRGYYFDDTYASESSYVDSSYLDRKIMEVPEGKHFIFFTDSHYDYDNGIGRRQNETPVIKYVRDRLGIRNVIFGGDCIGIQSDKYKAAKVLSNYAKEKFEAFGSGFLFVMGNHDTNTPNLEGSEEVAAHLIDDLEIYKRTTRFIKEYGLAVFPEKLLSIIDSVDTLVDQAGNIMSSEEKANFKAWAMRNYYYDDDRQRIRYIVLETGDLSQTMRNIFGATADAQNSLMTIAHFLIEALSEVKTGYDVVVVGHWFATAGAFWEQVFYRILSAYKNKQSVSVNFTPLTYHHPAVKPIVDKTFDDPSSLNGITVDFSGCVGSGRVFGISGHRHFDRAFVREYVSDNVSARTRPFLLSTSPAAQTQVYDPDNDEMVDFTTGDVLYIICDRCCGIGQGSGYRNATVSECYSYPNNGAGEAEEQRIGTINEVLFDVVTITNDDRVVLTRFGAEGMISNVPYVRNYKLPVAD